MKLTLTIHQWEIQKVLGDYIREKLKEAGITNPQVNPDNINVTEDQTVEIDIINK